MNFGSALIGAGYTTQQIGENQRQAQIDAERSLANMQAAQERNAAMRNAEDARQASLARYGIAPPVSTWEPQSGGMQRIPGGFAPGAQAQAPSAPATPARPVTPAMPNVPVNRATPLELQPATSITTPSSGMNYHALGSELETLPMGEPAKDPAWMARAWRAGKAGAAAALPFLADGPGAALFAGWPAAAQAAGAAWAANPTSVPPARAGSALSGGGPLTLTPAQNMASQSQPQGQPQPAAQAQSQDGNAAPLAGMSGTIYSSPEGNQQLKLISDEREYLLQQFKAMQPYAGSPGVAQQLADIQSKLHAADIQYTGTYVQQVAAVGTPEQIVQTMNQVFGARGVQVAQVDTSNGIPGYVLIHNGKPLSGVLSLPELRQQASGMAGSGMNEKLQEIALKAKFEASLELFKQQQENMRAAEANQAGIAKAEISSGAPHIVANPNGNGFLVAQGGQFGMVTPGQAIKIGDTGVTAQGTPTLAPVTMQGQPAQVPQAARIAGSGLDMRIK